jgi:hypothetical protein
MSKGTFLLMVAAAVCFGVGVGLLVSWMVLSRLPPLPTG